MKKIIAIITFAALPALLTGCGGEDGIFVDKRDGKKYKTVKIGEQVWLAENINNDGGGKCYDDDPSNCAKYGRLYTWVEALTACPAGWHLPSDEEWTQLTDFAAGSSYESKDLFEKHKLAKELKSKTGWNENYGTDDYGFSALPGGFGESDGSFGGIGYWSLWWSTTEDDTSQAWNRNIHGANSLSRGNWDKTYLFSVRCVKGKPSAKAKAEAEAAVAQARAEAEAAAVAAKARADSIAAAGFPSLKPSEIGEFVSKDTEEGGDAYGFHTDPNGEYYHFASFASDGDTQWDGFRYDEKFTATSTLAPQGKTNYSTENFRNTTSWTSTTYEYGGKRGTTWCEGVKGYGIGERVTMSITTQAAYKDVVSFYRLLIVNGFAKNAATWKNNARVKTMRLYVGGKPWCDLQLADVMKPQIFKFHEELHILPAKAGKKIPATGKFTEEFSSSFPNKFPVYQTDLSFEIIDVYSGDKYDDTCITGIALEVASSGVY